MNEAEPMAGSLSELLGLLLSSGRSGPDSLVLAVAVICGVALVAIHGSIAVRLVRMSVLVRDITALYESGAGGGRDALLRDLDRTFAGSLLADSWSELMRRRRELEAHAPEDRAPIRLADLLVDRPLIPLGIRRRTMKALPLLLASLGLASTLGMLAGGLGSLVTGEPISSIIGLSLRGAFWGVIMGALAATLAAVLEGTADALAAQLSLLVERSYRSLTPIEAQLRGAEAQRLGFERVSSLLVQVAQDLRDSLDRGLGRIERSTASAANLVGEEQRRVLELVIDDLSGLLRRGVEDQMGALRTSLQRAADQQEVLGAHVVTTIDQMTASADSNTRVSGALERAAQAVDEAAGTMAGSAGELKPLIVHLGEVAATLERAAGRVEQAEALAGPEDGDTSEVLHALRDDVARIGAQFLDGAAALQHSVESFQTRQETHAERDVAQALQNFDDRADALRDRLDEPSAAAPQEPAALEPVEPEPASTSTSNRRGGDLASALARSGEPLEAAADVGDSATAPEAFAPEAPPQPQTDEFSESDLEPVGRGGFSALLSRYKAPQFSIDELPPDLREFTADEAAERARGAGPGEGTDPTDLLDQTETLEPPAEAEEPEPAANEQASLDPEAEGISSEEADRRRRLNRFLGSRSTDGS